MSQLSPLKKISLKSRRYNSNVSLDTSPCHSHCSPTLVHAAARFRSSLNFTLLFDDTEKFDFFWQEFNRTRFRQKKQFQKNCCSRAIDSETCFRYLLLAWILLILCYFPEFLDCEFWLHTSESLPLSANKSERAPLWLPLAKLHFVISKMVTLWCLFKFLECEREFPNQKILLFHFCVISVCKFRFGYAQFDETVEESTVLCLGKAERSDKISRNFLFSWKLINAVCAVSSPRRWLDCVCVWTVCML